MPVVHERIGPNDVKPSKSRLKAFVPLNDRDISAVHEIGAEKQNIYNVLGAAKNMRFVENRWLGERFGASNEVECGGSHG